MSLSIYELLGAILPAAPVPKKRTKSVKNDNQHAIVQMLEFASNKNGGKLP